MNPKTRININGNAKAKNIADGVLSIACRLALINERMACALLYVDIGKLKSVCGGKGNKERSKEAV
jgi:hypothetical protein